MIIARNDEAKRSRIWRVVTLVSTALIIVIGIFLLTKLFTNNPLEGTWNDEDGRVNLKIDGKNTLTAKVMELGDGAEADVQMNYTINKSRKTVTITTDEAQVQKTLKGADGKYEEEELRNILDTLSTTFDYSVDQERLTLSEREYGEQMIFVKE